MGTTRQDARGALSVQLEKAFDLLAIGYRWDGKRCRLYFRMVAGSFTDEKLIEFLAPIFTNAISEVRK